MKEMPIRWTYLLTGFIFLLSLKVARCQEVFMESEPETVVTVEAIAPDNGTAVSAGVNNVAAANDDLFGGRAGYIHPSLSLNGYYTSNFFRTAKGEQSERYAVIVPGIWLAFPPRNQRQPEIGTSNTAPGGLSLSRFTMERERRVQGYAQYQANIRKHDRYPQEDRTDHRFQGMLKLSSRAGFSLEIADVFETNSDPYGTGGRMDRSLDIYDANLFNAILVSRLSPKVQLRADYGRYRLNYTDARNTYRDRNDDSYSGYLFFQTTPRTSLFFEGEYVAVNYDEAKYDDIQHNNYFLGIQIQPGTKTRGRLKAGYGRQDYGAIESDDFLAEAQLDYYFTPKTSVTLQGTRRILESDQVGARSILSHRILVGYRQRVTAKWGINANFFFNRNEYDGTVNIGNRIAANYYHDEFGGALALAFAPRRWMNLSLGYEYRERDSNFDSEDFRNNTVFLRATAEF